MSSTQKRGFRLRWAADNAPDEGGDAAASEASELEPADVSLSEAGTEHETERDMEMDDVNERDARPAAMMSPDETTDAAPAASPLPQTAAEAQMMDTASATSQSEDEVAVEAAEQGNPWPSSDAPRDSRPPIQLHRTSRVPTRDNPLVAGLVKAMREAALASRAETTSRLQGEAAGRVEAIRADATDESANLRKRVDDDIARIREWSKGEMARIRAETEGRIETRRAEAITENKEHLDGVERRVDVVKTTVAAFEADMDRFFKELLAEADPARLATLASQAPEPPDFSNQLTPNGQDEDARSAYDDSAGAEDGRDVLEPEAAAEAEAEATEGLDMTNTDPWAGGRGNTAPDEAEQHGSGNSRLFVNGLTSVADISAFKGAVGQLDGVRSVSVSSGEGGVFIFNVGHDPDADLASAIASLSGFAVQIMEAAGDSLTVTAHESAA